MNFSRIYAIAFGVVYTLVGIVGFFVAPTLAVGTLIIFPVNVLHNIVHLLFGLAGIAAFMSGRTVEYARGAAVLFAVLAIVGLIVPNGFGLVPLGGTDVALHALTAILAAVAGWLYRPQGAATKAAY
jgi:type IV secretory pathway TrbL component